MPSRALPHAISLHTSSSSRCLPRTPSVSSTNHPLDAIAPPLPNVTTDFCRLQNRLSRPRSAKSSKRAGGPGPTLCSRTASKPTISTTLTRPRLSSATWLPTTTKLVYYGVPPRAITARPLSPPRLVPPPASTRTAVLYPFSRDATRLTFLNGRMVNSREATVGD